MQDTFVDVKKVTYTHWNQKSPTLQELSLQMQRGTINVLVGPSGSGKSTLCNLLNGAIPHLLGGNMEGEVWVDGLNTRVTEVKTLAQKVGHVLQDAETMFATLYVEDEIAFGPENLLIDAEIIRKTVDELLEITALKPYRHNLVWNLSGGQIQKLGLALVLAMQPELVVLDEPTSNLDPVATRWVHELILSLREQGKTVLLVTRELDDFLAMADQLLVLEEGRLLCAGAPREVLAEHGEYLVNSLGVWLPETAEIGIALKRLGNTNVGSIPITIDETCALLAENNLIPTELIGDDTRREKESSVAGEVLIEARDVVYSYGKGINALKGVSLEVRAGEMLAIVGRNGAGKSTLAKLMVGLLKPTQGELTLFGKSAKAWNLQELANNIALVFQNPEHQFLTDTVSDEIGYSLLAHGVIDPVEQQEAIQKNLKLLGLDRFQQVHPFALSAGMKRRLGVATMLVCQPRILLVDEPTYGQDKQMTITLMSLMEDIRSRGIAVVMITHDMRLVQEYAERVVVMSEGEILYDGAADRLFEQKGVLDNANLYPTQLTELLHRFQAQGCRLCGGIHNTTDFLKALQIIVPS
ncbi:MAG: energy-coupling factor transporter ATPase [Anaerolineaceae bacterium]|nr:energy-coupling factor transporter ATPase [Anaerolineaceae bacterium]